MVRYLGAKPPSVRKRSVKKRQSKRRQHVTSPLSGGGMSYYTSTVPYMRGRGLGGSIVSLFKRIIPFIRGNPKIRAGLTRVGKSVASAGLSAAQSALNRENPQKFKTALRQSVREEARKLIQEAQRGKSIKGRVQRQNTNSEDIFS